jgi:hypothetical protein
LTNTTENVGRVRLLRESVGPPTAVGSPRHDPRPGHTVNTSRVTEEDLQSLDENEVIHVVAATGWVAQFEDGSERPLVCWAVLEDDTAHCVIVSHGEIDVSESVADEDGFVGYRYIGGR